MKIMVSDLGLGQEFTTCLTGRRGIVLDNDGRDIGVRVALTEPAQEKNLHPHVIVDAVIGLNARLR